MCHRIREAMTENLPDALVGTTIVADETWIRGKPGNRRASKRSLYNVTPSASFPRASPSVLRESAPDQFVLTVWLKRLPAGKVSGFA
jgi:hypothetical protein